MASEIPLVNPVSVPKFESKLPPTLLEGLSDREAYLYQCNDEIKQAVAWMANLSAATANRVEQVHHQALLTNGGLTQTKADIVELKQAVTTQKQEVQPVVRAYSLAARAVRSKLFWAAAAVLFLIVLPWAVSIVPPPDQLLLSLFRWAT